MPETMIRVFLTPPVMPERMSPQSERIGEEKDLRHRQWTKSGQRTCAGMLLGLVASLARSCAGRHIIRVRGNGRPVKRKASADPNIPAYLNAARRAGEPKDLIHSFSPRLAMQDSLTKPGSRRAQHPFPTLGLSSQYLNTQGNDRVPTGRYVPQDGVHVYREWSVGPSPSRSGAAYRRIH